MLESIPAVIAVAAILGFLSGIGIGGGSLLMLWLTIVLKIPQQEARIINLLFFVPAALIACLFRWRQGLLDLPRILPAIISGCAAAYLFSRFAMIADTGLLKKLFGILLLVTGTRELLYKPKDNARSGN